MRSYLHVPVKNGVMFNGLSVITIYSFLGKEPHVSAPAFLDAENSPVVQPVLYAQILVYLSLADTGNGYQ